MDILNLILIIGITIFWIKQSGLAPALAGLCGMLVLIYADPIMPWWATFTLAIWLSYIVRNWNKPEPKISDTK